MSVTIDGKTEVTGKTIIGGEIPESNLAIYYDISNPTSYPGTGDIVYDLSRNRINATLTGSGASRPAFVQSAIGNTSYLSFISSSQHYMYYVLPSWGASYTNISIYASPSASWDNEGDIGATRRNLETPGLTNGFVKQAYPPPSSSLSAVEYDAGGVFGYTNYGTITPTSIEVPHLYYDGYDHNTGDYFYGIDRQIYSVTPGSPLSGRGIRTDAKVYFARLDPIQEFIYGNRLTSIKLYAHLLYERKITIGEMRVIINFFANRFNF